MQSHKKGVVYSYEIAALPSIARNDPNEDDVAKLLPVACIAACLCFCLCVNADRLETT